jgi:hypothetical protein
VTLPDFNGDGSDTDGDSVDDGTGMYVIQDAGTDLIGGGKQSSRIHHEPAWR